MGLKLAPSQHTTPSLKPPIIRSFVMTTDSPFKRSITPKNGKWFELEELQALVGGRIERVDHASPHHDMYINEEGKLEALAYNKTATDEWDYELAGINDVIVGDAVVIHHQHLVDFYTEEGETHE
jgi:hypothetical protein